MPPFDDFIHISTDPLAVPSSSSSADHGVPSDYYSNATGKRWSTEAMLVDSLQRHHPKHHINVTSDYALDLMGFGDASDDVSYYPHGNPDDALVRRQFIPPARRYNDENGGFFAHAIQFGCYDYISRISHSSSTLLRGLMGL